MFGCGEGPLLLPTIEPDLVDGRKRLLAQGHQKVQQLANSGTGYGRYFQTLRAGAALKVAFRIDLDRPGGRLPGLA